MRALFPPGRPAFRFFALFLALLSLAIAADGHAALRTFSRRFNANANGDIVLTGNSLMTCNPVAGTGAATCLAARDRTAIGGDLNNNNHSMIPIDNDADTSTAISSSADLSMPAGSSVLWAGLYWSGESNTATTRGQALFGVPGSFGYTPVSAGQVDFDGSTPARYSSFCDVTDLVRSAGNGTYWVANIQYRTPSATNSLAGWSLVVVYGNYSHPLRNLAVFDGMQSVTGSPGVRIDVNGFLSPLSGPVVTKLGAVVLEGDANLTGDYLSLNGSSLFEGGSSPGTIRPLTNFYNSYITDSGLEFTAKTPNYKNQLGFDIASRVNVPVGIVRNGDTGAYFNVATGGEQVYPVVLSFSTDLYVPIITPNLVKTVTDLNGGSVVPGDVLRFTVAMTNSGLDTATTLTLSDNIPQGTTYVPESLRVTGGANVGVKTDAAGDDQAEYLSSGTPRVVFRLGTGADTASGGMLPYTGSTSLTFDVTVNAGLASGTVLTNSADISYNGQTINTQFAGVTSAATASVLVPPSIAMSFSPNPVAVNGTSTMSVVVSNPGTNPDTLTGVGFSDTYPALMLNTGTPNAAVTCTAGSSGSLTGGVASGNTVGLSGATILPGGSCTVSVQVASGTSGNYTNTTSAVTSGNGGNGSTASGIFSVGKPAVTAKTFSPSSILAGDNTTVSLTLTNPSLVLLTGVAFTDPLVDMLVHSAPGVTSDCGGAVSAAAGASAISLSGGTLAPEGSCTITARVTSSTAGIRSNQAGGVTSNESAPAGIPSNVAFLDVSGPPVAAVSFSPASIRTSGNGGVSRLQVTVSNPNSSLVLTGVAFTATDNGTLVNDATPNSSISCTGGSSATKTGGTAGGNTLGISGGTLLPGGSCTVSVNVSSTNAGTFRSTTSAISSTNGGSGAVTSANLNVTSLTPPTVAKTFSPDTFTAGSASTLTITLTNPNAAGAGRTMTGVAFTDNYPSGMINMASPSAATTCTNGSVTAAPGGGSVSLSGASIPGAGSCTVTVQVTAQTQGGYYNIIPAGAVMTDNAAVSAADAWDNVTANAGPIATTFFSANPILPGDNTTLSIAINNPNAFAITGVAFTDSYPPGLRNLAVLDNTNSCGGTVTTAANGTSLSLSGGTVAGRGSCLVTVKVTAPAAGSYTNSTGTVSTTNAGTGPAGVTTLTAMGPPTVSASFTPNPVLSGASSVYSVTMTNANTSAINGAAFTASYPANLFNAASPSVSNTCGGTVTAAAGGTSLALIGGTLPSSASCTISVNVAPSGAGSYAVSTGSVTTSNAGTGTSAAATLNVTLGISGTVFNDANHTGGREAGENGTGLSLYVKLATRSGSTCQSPALFAAVADPATGDYSFTGIASGDYCLVLDTNGTLSDIASTIPALWTATLAPTGIRQVTAAGPSLTQQDFGLYGGSSISGRVFRDTGSGGGTANDGFMNGTEGGIAGVSVQLVDDSGATVYETKVSDGSGGYTLQIPGTLATGTALKVVCKHPPTLVATGGDTGNSAGTYDRSTGTVRFTLTQGNSYSGVNFGGVGQSRLMTDGVRTALPGSVVFHPHTFVAGTAGTLTLSTEATPSPALAGWSEPLFRDVNCNGTFDSGETPVSGPFAVVAGETVCLLMKEFVPSGAPFNAQNSVQLTALLAFANAAPPLSVTMTRSDLTTVGQPAGAGLSLSKSVDRATVLPGETLTYTIAYLNQAGESLSSIVIHDTTPPFTQYVSAACGTPLPADITACNVTSQPAPGAGGAIEWTMTGTLAPGRSGTVSFTLQVAN